MRVLQHFAVFMFDAILNPPNSYLRSTATLLDTMHVDCKTINQIRQVYSN